MNVPKSQASSQSGEASQLQVEGSAPTPINLATEVIRHRSGRVLDQIRQELETSRAQASQRRSAGGSPVLSAPSPVIEKPVVREVSRTTAVPREATTPQSPSQRDGLLRMARMAAFGLVALGVAHFSDLLFRAKSSSRSDEPTREKATHVEKAKSAPPPQRVTPETVAQKKVAQPPSSPTLHTLPKVSVPPSKEAKPDSKTLQSQSEKAHNLSPLVKSPSGALGDGNQATQGSVKPAESPTRGVTTNKQSLEALVVPKAQSPQPSGPTPPSPSGKAVEAPTTPPPVKGVDALKTEEIQGPPLYLEPTAKALTHNPLVERIQERLNDLNFTAPDGKSLLADGRFGSKTGFAIERYRMSAKLPPGQHIDQDLVDRLAPPMTMASIEKGFLTVSPNNAGKGSNPIVKEVQGLVNKQAKKNVIAESGVFSRELTSALREVQAQNGLKATGLIDNATVRLLRGESLDTVISLHGVVLSPSSAKGAPELPLVKAVQERLNTILGEKEKGPVHGRFDEATAKRLLVAQKAGRVRERGVLGAETLLMLEEVGKNPTRLELFTSSLNQVKLVDGVISKLTSERRQSLLKKLETCSLQKGDVTGGFIDMCEEVEVNLAKPDTIARFQGCRGLPKTGVVDGETAAHLDEVVTAHWYKSCVLNHEDCFDWKEGPNEINVVGLRGWDRLKGQNSNEFNQWNDTIAIVWTDDKGLTRVREYAGTTDPGLLSYSKSPYIAPDGRGAVGHLKPGQYKYKHAYYHGMSGFAGPIEDGEVRVFRDTNHDGLIDENDQPELQRAGPVSRLVDRLKSFWGDTSFMLHGMPTSADPNDVTSVGGFSAGCQVPRISIERFKREISPLLRNNPGAFPYTLIDMSTRDQFNSNFAADLARREGLVTGL